MEQESQVFFQADGARKAEILPTMWSNRGRYTWQKTVPWHYVHPQTDHVTFWPTWYIHPTFRPLWQFTTVTLRPFNILPLRQMDPVTFYYCDTSSLIQYIQVTKHPPSKSRTFCHYNRMSTYFWLDCDRTSIFALKRNVDILSHVTGYTWKPFGLFHGGWTKCHNGQNHHAINS